jgi:outer membrane protein assembly factor BamB
VYFGSGDRMLTALDVFNGALLWKSECPEIVTTTPCVNAESVFVGCNGGVVRAFSSRNGELTWRYGPKTESEAVNQVFETDAGIVTITGDGQCRVFHREQET